MKMEKKQVEKQDTQRGELYFQGRGIVDVTNFVMKSFSDAGYMCSCDVLIYCDGRIELVEDVNEREILECFSVQQIISANDQVGGFNPAYTQDVVLVTNEKSLRMSFYNEADKKKFWNAALAVAADNR